MLRTRRELEDGATALGVRADVLERVDRLVEVLRRLDVREGLADHYALKGGTALNLFWLLLPRLSADIDVNFVGDVEHAHLAAVRQDFVRGVVQCCQLAGCRVLHTPGEHAGGKLRLRFPSALGGTQNLEADVSFVARVPLHGLVRRRGTIAEFAEHEVSTYTLPELSAGKFAALFSRGVPRDRYDAVRLIELEPNLPDQASFRVAFTCQAASARRDCRKWSAPLAPLPARDVQRNLLPLLRREPGAAPPDARALAEALDRGLAPAVERILSWRAGERAFLDALMERGEIRPEFLSDDPALQRRIEAQPMLRWKRIHVRRRKGLPAGDGGADA
jgi:predicted nucleotidyltransferase component of viral defense system